MVGYGNFRGGTSVSNSVVVVTLLKLHVYSAVKWFIVLIHNTTTYF